MIEDAVFVPLASSNVMLLSLLHSRFARREDEKTEHEKGCFERDDDVSAARDDALAHALPRLASVDDTV